MLKTGISRDGKLRVNLAVTFRLSLEDLTNLWLARNAHVEIDLNHLIDRLNVKNKNDILAEIRQQLLSDGSIHSAYSNVSLAAGWFEKTFEVFNRRFPEFTPTQAQQLAIKKFKLGGAK